MSVSHLVSSSEWKWETGVCLPSSTESRIKTPFKDSESKGNFENWRDAQEIASLLAATPALCPILLISRRSHLCHLEGWVPSLKGQSCWCEGSRQHPPFLTCLHSQDSFTSQVRSVTTLLRHQCMAPPPVPPAIFLASHVNEKVQAITLNIIFSLPNWLTMLWKAHSLRLSKVHRSAWSVHSTHSALHDMVASISKSCNSCVLIPPFPREDTQHANIPTPCASLFEPEFSLLQWKLQWYLFHRASVTIALLIIKIDN